MVSLLHVKNEKNTVKILQFQKLWSLKFFVKSKIFKLNVIQDLRLLIIFKFLIYLNFKYLTLIEN